MVDGINKIIPKKITEQQKKDTGLALTLLFLIIGLYTGNLLFFKSTIPLILMTMLIPSILHPVAIVWFGIANFLGFFISKIVLSIIFIILIVPIGIIRRLFGKDSLRLKQFKVSTSSVLTDKNVTYKQKDILNPF